MKQTLLLVNLCFLSGIALVPDADARGHSAEAAWRLTTRIEPTCEVTPLGETHFTDLGFVIRAVRERCNTPGGYQIEARFTGLTGGTLEIGAERFDIGADGVVLIESDAPRLRTLSWRVRQAKFSADAVPTLTIAVTPH